MKKTKNQIFLRPELFCALAIFYFAGAVLSAADLVMTSFDKCISVSGDSMLVWLFGLGCFFAGSFAFSRILLSLKGWKKWLPMVPGAGVVTAILYYMTGAGIFMSCLLSVSLALGSYLMFSSIRTEREVKRMFAFGLLCAMISFILTGIPIMKIGMHYDINLVLNPLFMLGIYSMLYSLVRMHESRPTVSRMLFMLPLLVSVLSTFRSIIAISFMTWALTEALRNGEGCGRKFAVSAAVSAAAVLVMFAFVNIGYANAVVSGNWPFNPVQMVEYRLAFTGSVFEKIIGISMPWGYAPGSTLEMPLGLLQGMLFYGVHSNLTSTVFGEMMLEGGLPAVFLAMLFCGGFLGQLYKKDSGLYALMMAHMIVAIETGVNFFFLAVYFYIGYIALMARGETSE